MPAEVLLEVRGLTKRFEGLVALDGVDFEVSRGEIFGVIGPNGAGKTTLFSCLAGSVAPTAGELRFLGEPLSGLACWQVVARGLVRTHQIVRPFRAMTVEENVAIGARFGSRARSGDARGPAAVAAILDRTGLTRRARALAGTLTIGESKRLEIARALATGPAAICLDEVMGGLNPTEILEAMALIRSIRAEGVTVLLIEHHIRAVAGLSDRILVLDFGRKIAEGIPSAVMRSPEVVRAYLGETIEAQG
jgi:branched-chain amino acid transport system ATP-binding protein